MAKMAILYIIFMERKKTVRVRLKPEQKNTDLFLEHIITKYHLKCEDRTSLAQIYEQLRQCMTCRAVYRINQRCTGIEYIDNQQSAAVAITLGDGVDRLRDKYANDGCEDKARLLDYLANEMLAELYDEFNSLYARFHRRYVKKYIFIGEEIPLDRLPVILEDIQGKRLLKLSKETGAYEETLVENEEKEDRITVDEQGMLTPKKSVVFLAILSENPKDMARDL